MIEDAISMTSCVDLIEWVRHALPDNTAALTTWTKEVCDHLAAGERAVRAWRDAEGELVRAEMIDHVKGKGLDAKKQALQDAFAGLVEWHRLLFAHNYQGDETTVRHG